MSQLMDIGKGFSWSKVYQNYNDMVEELEEELLKTNLSSEERKSIEDRLGHFKWLIAMSKL